jgi:hypothetical protein
VAAQLARLLAQMERQTQAVEPVVVMEMLAQKAQVDLDL